MLKFNLSKTQKGGTMGKILLNTANITCNNKKETDLRAYVNGKVVNTLNYDSKEVIMEYADTDFVFLIDENMETSDSKSDVSLMREIRRYTKKYKDSDVETKFSDFEEYISTTVTYLDNLEASGEIPPMSRQVSAAVISYDKGLLAVTDTDSAMYISGGNIVKVFPDDDNIRIKTAQLPALKTNDLIILLSETIAKAVSSEDILDRINTYDSAEAIAQNISSLYTSNNNEEFSVTVILVKLIQDKSRTLMRSEINTQEIPVEEIQKSYTAPIQQIKFEGKPAKKESFWDETTEDVVFTDKKAKSAKASSFDSIKLSKSESRKRRTSIYIKRAVSIIVVLAVMAGIIIGMVNLLKLIFNKRTSEESPTPSSTYSPIVVESPSPTPTPELTPSEEPSESPEPTMETQYIIHKVKVTTDHTSLNQIATYYNDVYSLNYPNTAIFVEVIAGLNEIADVNMIFAGQEIKIPITPVP